MSSPPKPGPAPTSEPIPIAIRQTVLRVAASLSEHHGDAFIEDSQLRIRVAGLLRRSLPPRRRPGRPEKFPSVTAAIRIHSEIKREHPELSSKQCWQQTYAHVIEGWNSMDVEERKQKREWLQERVGWRKKATRRRARQKRSGENTSELSTL
jgi:hypothetical protein